MHAFRARWTWNGHQILAVCYGATAIIVLVTLMVDRIRYGRDGFKARWDRSWPGPRPLGSRALDLQAVLGLGMGVIVVWYLVTG